MGNELQASSATLKDLQRDGSQLYREDPTGNLRVRAIAGVFGNEFVPFAPGARAVDLRNTKLVTSS